MKNNYCTLENNGEYLYQDGYSNYEVLEGNEDDDICPLCKKKRLIYGDYIVDDNNCKRPWMCGNCFGKGINYYHLVKDKTKIKK